MTAAKTKDPKAPPEKEPDGAPSTPAAATKHDAKVEKSAPQTYPRGLYAVKPNCSLFWCLAGFPLRGREGTIIDGREIDHPGFIERKGFPPQTYKLRLLSPEEAGGLEPSPCTNRKMWDEYCRVGLDKASGGWMTFRDPAHDRAEQYKRQAEERLAARQTAEHVLGDDFKVPPVDPERLAADVAELEEAGD